MLSVIKLLIEISANDVMKIAGPVALAGTLTPAAGLIGIGASTAVATAKFTDNVKQAAKGKLASQIQQQATINRGLLAKQQGITPVQYALNKLKEKK